MKYRVILVSLVFALFLAGCAATSAPLPRWQGEGHPQDLTPFAEQIQADRALLAPEAQARLDEIADQRFFAPWRQSRTSMNAAAAAPYGISEGKFAPRGFAENLQRWDAGLWALIARNCNAAAFPSMSGQAGRAVVTQNNSLRVLPTLRPMFQEPERAGQGYPFDMLQNSGIWAGTPVYVAHASADGAWLFCETAYAAGWVPTLHVAFTDEAFRTAYSTGRYAAIVRDESPIRDTSGSFLTQAHTGAIFPLTRQGERMLVPLRERTGKAVFVEAPMPAESAAQKPLPMTPQLVAAVGNRMLGKAYGWGGLYEDRDCSATMRDLFAPFGLWLPRNSAAQAKVGQSISLAKLSAAEKERIIREQAKPFRTLLCMPGHIGLYIGQWQGRAAMYHTVWGLRTLEDGKEGRLVIGKTTISSLAPGRDIPQVQSLLVDRITSMAILGE